MKKIFSAAVLSLFVAFPAFADNTSTPGYFNTPTGTSEIVDSACQWISGYFRSDGTYVQGHYRGC